MTESMIDRRYLDEMVEVVEKGPSGCVVEVGVYKGGSALRLYEVCECQKRQLHLFDTFNGFPVEGPDDGWKLGELNPGPGTVVHLKTMMPGAFFWVGQFPHTMPSEGFKEPIAFVHADADQYWTTLRICTHLYPKLAPGGSILFDDYGDPKTKGCTKAVNEFVAMMAPGCLRRSPNLLRCYLDKRE